MSTRRVLYTENSYLVTLRQKVKPTRTVMNIENQKHMWNCLFLGGKGDGGLASDIADQTSETPGSMRKQALIIDDHPIVRDGMKELLQQSFPSIIIKSSCGSSGASGLLRELCAYPWSFVVLDLNLPGVNGLDIIKKTHTCCPKLPIFAFSLYSQRQYAARVLRAGAVGYVSKDCSPQVLVQVVQQFLEGEPVKQLRGLSKPLLSDRELQVLTLLVRGESRKNISAKLGITVKTISTHMVRLMRKLDVSNIVELIRYAIEERLVD
jgi:DNA-binding NarL/FixJ family response regulator